MSLTPDSQSKPALPPKATKKEHTSSYHGHTLSDPYFWLKDPKYPTVEDEDVLGYLKEENAYYESAMAPHKELSDTIFDEIVGRIKEDDSSVPYKLGPYLYSWKFEKGAQYRQWIRTELDGKKSTVIADEVKLADGHDYFRLGGLALTPDYKQLAWTSDCDGSERYTVRVKHIDSGEVLSDEISGTSGSIVWAASGEEFLYTLLSEELRPYKVMLHKIGSAVEEDVCLYEEKDPSFFVGIGKTSSKKWLTISAGDHVTSETRLILADAPRSEARMVSARRENHEYSVDDCGDTLYILSNDTHKNCRLLQVALDDPAEKNWQEIIPASDTCYLTGFQCFQDFMIVAERSHGQEQLRVRDYEGAEHHVAFPEDSFTAGLGSNAEFDTQVLRVGYQSMITPPSVFDYHLKDRKLELLKVQEIPSGYQKNDYVTERLMATSHDGVQVPISIVYKKGFVKDGTSPVHLYGYGAYGSCMPPAFSVSRLSLLDRGFAYAIAHIRGGAEMGYQWYQDGKLMKRTNTFKDFVACAEHLVEAGFAKTGQISTSGGSAGGSLMGAIANMRPDMWKAIVAHVPFVDILNTMLDDTLPLTPIEWPEWGNPITDKEAYEYILSYSPYENTTAKDYPMMMVTAGLNDPRVTYWEPAKWVAKLRELKTDDNLLIYKTNMGAGHGGKSGRFERFVEVAEEYTFLLKAFERV